mgnify:CR=1 FL=1
MVGGAFSSNLYPRLNKHNFMNKMMTSDPLFGVLDTTKRGAVNSRARKIKE